MNRITRIFALIHVPLWGLFCLVIGIQLGSSDDQNWFWTALGIILSCLFVFYTHFFVLTRYFQTKKKTAYLLRLAGIFVTGPVPFLIFHYQNISGPNSVTDLYFITLVLVVPVFLFLSWLTRITHTLIINTIKKEELEKQAVQAELHYLKSQINPHFLFNTLNNIHTLVYKQAPTAPEAVIQLSSLMRYMIYESNAPTVPVSKEIKFLKDYIGLQQLRYHKSSIVNLKLEGDLGSVHTAPLLFIQLLENSYKHSPAALEPGAIKVTISLKDNILLFSVKNPTGKTNVSTFDEAGGIGIPNVRKRLALLYPDQHHLEINRSEDFFLVTLKIENLKSYSHEKEDQLLYN